MAVNFAKLPTDTPLLTRVQENITDAFEKCMATAMVFGITTSDPAGQPSPQAPRFLLNTRNLRLWVNCVTSWHYVQLV